MLAAGAVKLDLEHSEVVVAGLHLQEAVPVIVALEEEVAVMVVLVLVLVWFRLRHHSLNASLVLVAGLILVLVHLLCHS